jgi:hypothetical protein
MMKLALVVAASLANPVGFNTSQSIADQCGTKSSYLLGYLAGLADSFDNIKEAHPTTQAFCLPPDVTLAQIESVVCTYLGQRPPRDMGLTNAALHATRALAAAYPCP